MTTNTDVRNSTDLMEFVSVLKDQHARKMDVVLTPDAIRYTDEGRVVITLADGDRWEMTPEGFFERPTSFEPSRMFYETAARHLDIPGGYLTRLVNAELHPVIGANLNGWLDHNGRKVMLRSFTGDNPVARALVSDKFKIIDNLDVALSVIQGITAAGVKVELTRADLSDRRMYLRFNSPDVEVLAPEFLQGYKDPWNGRYGGSTGDTPPVVRAGFDVRNSEVGDGSAEIIPVIEVLACKNGLVLPARKFRRIHLGGRQDTGVIQWSEDTQHKLMEVLKLQARDAVAQFLSDKFVRDQLAEIEAKAAQTLQTGPMKVVEVIAKKLAFSQAESDDILAAWVQGGQTDRAGGVLQAVTAAAHKAPSPDRAAEIEEKAWEAMDLAVAVRA